MAIKKYRNLRNRVFIISTGTGQPNVHVDNAMIVMLDEKLAEKYPSWFSEIEEVEAIEELNEGVDEEWPIEEDLDVTAIREATDNLVDDVSNQFVKDIDEELTDVEPENEAIDYMEEIKKIEAMTDEEEVRKYADKNFDLKLGSRKKLPGCKKELLEKMTDLLNSTE